MTKIYVADLEAYNAGHLIGEWIDAAQEPEDIQDEIDQMLYNSPFFGEEWAIHDTDDFGSIRLGESEPLERVSMIAKLLEEYGDIFEALYKYDNSIADNYDDWVNEIEERYQGGYEDMAEYAEEYIKSTVDMNKFPDFIWQYFDYEAYGRDLSYDLITVEHGLLTYVYLGA